MSACLLLNHDPMTVVGGIGKSDQAFVICRRCGRELRPDEIRAIEIEEANHDASGSSRL